MQARDVDRRTRNSRNEILDAAEQVVATKGANHLTIDAVAEASGFSKGGVLYNFPTKQALIEGLLDRTVESHEKRVEEAMNRTAGPNRTLKAILSTHSELPKVKSHLVEAFLAAMAEDPEFVGRIQPMIRGRADRIAEEAEDAELSLILWLALEGMVLLNALNLYEIPNAMRRRLEDRLNRMMAA